MSWADKIKENHLALVMSAEESFVDITALQEAVDTAPPEAQQAILKALGLATEDKAGAGQALAVAGQLLQTAIKHIL